LGGIARSPDKIIPRLDVVFNALHGKYGEDGKVQKFLERFNVPFTGSGSFPSALGMHKGLSKKMFAKHKIKTPYHIIISPRDNTRAKIIELFQTFPQPSIIKPITGGSSLATTLATDFVSFSKGIEEAFHHAGAAVIEEFINGQEATCGVLEKSDGTGAYALYPVEIAGSSGKEFYDYEAKYEGESIEICPSTFTKELKQEIQELALLMHMALGMRHYSCSDFMIHPTRGIYALETNSLPGLTERSLYPKSLTAMGLSFGEFLDHLLTLALRERR
jgi:D-alanine-D-alanine ligase